MIVSQPELAARLTKAAALAKRSKHHPFDQVRIEPTTRGLHITASDGQSFYSTSVAGQGEDADAFLIPAELAAKTVSLLGDGDVEITRDGNNVVLCGDFSEYKLTSAPAEDYPLPHLGTEVAKYDLKESFFGNVRRCAYALPKTDHRRILMGFHILFDSRGFQRIEATDGKKLAWTPSNPFKDSTSVVLDAGPLLEIAKDPWVFEAKIHETCVEFTGRTESWIVSRIEGKYPNIEAVVPKPEDAITTVIADHEELLQAIKRLSPVAPDNRATEWRISKGSIDLNAQCADVGSASTGVAAEVKGSDISLAMSDRLAIDTLAAFSSDIITIRISGHDKPVVFEGAKADIAAVVMPIKQTGAEQ